MRNINKLSFIGTLLLIFGSITVQAQTSASNETSNPVLLGLDYQVQEFQMLNQRNGDACNCLESSRLNKRAIQSYNLSLFKMNKDWAFEAALGYASGYVLNDDKVYNRFKSAQTRVGAFYHFYQAENRLRPFITAGLQFSLKSEERLMSLPLGLGLRYRMGSTYLHWQTSYDYGLSDNIAQNLITQIGLQFSLKKAKKSTDKLKSDPAPLAVVNQTAVVPAKSASPANTADSSAIAKTDNGQLAANQAPVAEKPVAPVVADPQTPVAQKQQQAQLAKVVYFDTDKWSLNKPATVTTLNEVLAFVKNYPDTKIMLSGHTDSVLAQSYNLPLSKRRVEAVKAWLMGQGVSSARISTEFSGEIAPAANNQTEEGRALNRRVEIKIQ